MKVTVIKVSEQTSNGNYIHTLESSQTINVLGIDKVRTKKYLLALPEAAKVKSEHEITLADYEVTTLESAVVDENTGEERILRSTWLF